MILVRNKHNNELFIKHNAFISLDIFRKDFILVLYLKYDFRDFGISAVSSRNINDLIVYFNERIDTKVYELNKLKNRLEILKQINKINNS